MPGRNRTEPADAREILATLARLKSDVAEMRPKLAAGEADQGDALDLVLQGIMELVDAAEPLLTAYRIRHN